VLHELLDWVQRNMTVEYTSGKFEQDSALKKWVTAKTRDLDPCRDGLSCYEILMYAAMIAGCLNPSEIEAAFEAAQKGAKEAKRFRAPQAYDEALKKALFKGSIRGYSLVTHIPPPGEGDIVFINGLMHVALATGESVSGSSLPHRHGVEIDFQVAEAKIIQDSKGAKGSMEAEVASFWPRYVAQIMDDESGKSGKVFAGVKPPSLNQAPVEITTIEDLVLGLAREVNGADSIDYSKYKVEFARPVWAKNGY
jgi:hypothetical protein